MRTKLTAAWVVGHAAGGHVLLQNGEVVFSGSTIDFVGRAFPGPVDLTIDYGQAIIGPGFIDLDALGDIDTTVLAFDNGPEWRLGRVWSEDYLRAGPTETFTPEEELFKYRYAFTQLIRNGITTALPITSMLYRAWAESYDEFAAVAALAGEMGIRVYLGPCFLSGLTFVRDDGSLHQHFDEARGLTGLAEAERYLRDFDGAAQGRIRGFLAPDRIETQVPSVLARTAALARETGVPVRLHCCQSVYEFETVKRLHGCTPYGWLEQLGLMTERAIFPHGIYVSGHPAVSERGDDDLTRLAASGATIAHCPIVFARDGEALASFGRYRLRGIRFGLGTDTMPPDIVENMRQGLSIAHLMEGGAKLTTVADFYNAATLGGAAALGRDDLGRLAPGCKADISIFDLSALQIGPVIDPIKSLVIAGSGRDCRAVYIDGRLVMEEFAVTGVDEVALTCEADRLLRKAMHSFAGRAIGQPRPHDIFRHSFPLA